MPLDNKRWRVLNLPAPAQTARPIAKWEDLSGKDSKRLAAMTQPTSCHGPQERPRSRHDIGPGWRGACRGLRKRLRLFSVGPSSNRLQLTRYLYLRPWGMPGPLSRGW